MRILIATASRHGSTRELGRWLGTSITDRLATGDTSVEIRDAADVDSIAEYDAVIIGSAVYMGRWLREARSLVEREQTELESRPVWLFSSGPIGKDSNDAASSSDAASSKWDKAPWAIEHRVFGGKLDRSTLSRFERLVVRMVRAGDGDDRSHDAVDAWADTICTTLKTGASRSATEE